MNGDERSAHELLVQAHGGDVQAIGVLFGRYRGALVHTAMRRGLSLEEASDAVQEVFYRVIKAIPQYDKDQGGGFTWVSHFLTYEILHQWGQRNRVQEIQQRAYREEQVHPTVIDPEVEALRSEQEECVKRAKGRLAIDDRTEIERRYERQGRPSAKYRAAMDRLGVELRECIESATAPGGAYFNG